MGGYLSALAQTTHLPIGIGSSHYIEDLPHDMLLEIFSYLSFEDLVKSVQYVSSRWHRLSQENNLWRKLHYAPALETDEEIVDILKQCPKLQTFILDERAVGSLLLKLCLKNCTELRTLELTECQFNLSTQYVISLVLNCQNLKHLTIPYRIISVLGVAQKISQLEKLDTLDVVGNIDLQRSMWLRSIAEGCPMLQHIDIMLCKFFSMDFKYFMQMKQHRLESIEISCTTLDGRCTIPDLTVCKTLHEVAINHPCQFVTIGGCEALRSMEHISRLTLQNIEHSVVGNFDGLFTNKRMCHLEELEFFFYLGYKDELCETICNNCPLLNALSLTGCYELTDRSLENLPKLKNLKRLSLAKCKQFTDSGMNFVSKCTLLQDLVLMDCTQLTEIGMHQLTGLSLLENLLLDYYYIKVLPLTLILTSLTKLKYIIVNNCERVNRECLYQLRAVMPHLTIIER